MSVPKPFSGFSYRGQLSEQHSGRMPLVLLRSQIRNPLFPSAGEPIAQTTALRIGRPLQQSLSP